MNSKLFKRPDRINATIPVTARTASPPSGETAGVRGRTHQWVGRVAPRAPTTFDNPAGSVLPCHGARGATRPTFARRPGQRGVALVVTLILLVVITTLAVAFLALSHRETSAVSGSGNTLTAEWAADAAHNRATSQILGQI